MKQLNLLFALLIAASTAFSAESSSPNITVKILPEYDLPGVLVYFQGEVEEQNLPLRFEIAVPTETKFALGTGQSDSVKFLPLQVESREDGNWAVIDVIKPQFQIKYYYNPFTEDSHKAVDYPFRVNLDLENVHIAVQQPVASERFVFMEPNAEIINDNHGITYHQIHIPQYSEGDTKTISFTYENPSGKTSISFLREMLAKQSDQSDQSAQSTNEEDHDHEQMNRYQLPKYAPLLILGIIAIVTGFIFRKSRNGQSGTVEEKFCAQCGTQLKPEDIFCSKCGNKV